ncbi:MAG: TIGR00300 family protein, partial [Candidatus Zixiibacteriota bacterium]
MPTIEKIVATEGHLIDSGLMRKIFDTIIADGGSFEMLDFRIGSNNDEFSHARLKVACDNAAGMNTILLKLSNLGCLIETDDEIILKPAPADGVVTPDFYSSTNHATQIRHKGQWIDVDKIRMDGVIVVDNTQAEVRKLRDIKKGNLVVTGLSGIKVKPDFVERDRSIF